MNKKASTRIVSAGRLCALFLTMTLLTACVAAPRETVAQGPLLQVMTASGPVRGTLQEDVVAFKGLPYALPPTGERRWQPPAALEPWQDVRDASRFGPACPQVSRSAELVTDEDCLTLNVWTPAEAASDARLPVLFWIHGGGFRGGASSSPSYDGSNFARDGVVLVSINYRLGALGFFAHPLLEPEDPAEGWGTYGLMDMVAALEWVKSNIEGFGGDPGRVTIFGESAGGMAVQMLMVTPSAGGLFSGAIGMSGYGTWPLPTAGGAAATAIAGGIVERASGGQAPDGAAALRALPAADLAAAVEGLHLPIVDGMVLPGEPGVLFAEGRQHDVAFMTGADSYDGAVMRMAGMDAAAFLQAFGRDSGDGTEPLRELYADDFAVSDMLAATRLFGDNRYAIAGRYLAKNMSRVESPSYLYYFTFVPPARREEWPGAPHGSEVALLFGNGELDAESRAVGQRMRQRFVSFAQNGDPNVEGLPEWPAYNQVEDVWLVIGESDVAEPGVLRDKLDYLEGLYRVRLDAREPVETQS